MDTFVQGLVVDTNDPQQMGRLRVWCPSIDGENNQPENLPWARYVSPLAGQTVDYPVDGVENTGPAAYGFWAIPKQGATVIVGFLHGDRNQRFYLGSFFPDHGNRSLPIGRNSDGAPTTDSYEDLQPLKSNLETQFGDLSSPQARSRGAYERQVAQALTDKDGTEGYQKSQKENTAVDKQYDPQTYCLTTPGRHSIIMQDHPETSRLRIKTARGHQMIMDDANERIYVSTAKGNTWLELDEDGHVHVYAGADISMSTAGDFNVTAKGSFNVQAAGDINMAASGHTYISACKDMSMNAGDQLFTASGADTHIKSGASLYQSSASNLHIKAGSATYVTGGSTIQLNGGGSIIQTAGAIHLNGPGATAATDATEGPCPTDPSIVPNHEPWERPATSGTRNKNWKP
jgi:hypothetical protein